MNVSANRRVGDGPRLLAAATPGDRALLTYYDDASGERFELSAEALGAWVARTANLLVDGCGLGPGSRAAMLLPPHWQTAAVVLGTWSAGMAVDFYSLATAGLPLTTAESPIDLTFATLRGHDDTPPARVRFVLGLGSAPINPRDVPPGAYDYLAEVRRHGAEVRSYPVPSGPTAGDGSYEEWAAAARGMAAALQLRTGDRVLVDAATNEHPLRWLLAPLAAGASVVLCTNLDPGTVAARTAYERITRVL